jgi:hypothetical protein
MRLHSTQRWGRASILAAGVAMTLVSITGATAQTTRRIALPTGTVIPVKLDQTISSKVNRPGDRFTATVKYGQDDAGLPEGTKVEGVIRESLRSESNKPGVIDVEFRRIIPPDGDARTIEASVYSLDNKSVKREDGRLVSTGSNKSNERMKWVGIGAGAGALIAVLTKGNTLVDALLGGAAGYLYNELQGNKKPGDVELKTGAEFGVRLDRPLTMNVDDRAYRLDPRYRDDPNFRTDPRNRDFDRVGDPRDDRYYNDRNDRQTDRVYDSATGRYYDRVTGRYYDRNGNLTTERYYDPNRTNDRTFDRNTDRVYDSASGRYYDRVSGRYYDRNGNLTTDRYYDRNTDRTTDRYYDRNDTRVNGDIRMRIDNRNVAFNSTDRPFMRNNIVYVPIAAVSRAARTDYRWDPDSRVLTARNGRIRLAEASRVATVDGERRRMDAGMVVRNDVVYVPVQFVGYLANGTARWDEATRTVIVTTDR